MPRLQYVKNAFNTGEISPFAMGRTDFQGQSGNKYDHACESLQNFLPLIQGGATKRPGTLYVCPAHDANHSRLIPFKNLTTKGYIIELAGTSAYFFTRNGAIVDASTTTTADITLPGTPIHVVDTTSFPASGTILVNGQNVAYTSKTATTFAGCTGGVGFIPSGTTVGHQYSISTPYAANDLEGVKFAQMEDTMYLAHPSYPPQKLSRITDTNWVMSAPNFQPPPTHEFDMDYSGGTINLTLSTTVAGTSGTATASAPLWLAGDVGRFIVVGAGIAYINGFTSNLIVTITVVDTFASATPAAGTWFIRGAPSGIICVGFIAAGVFHSTATFGPSNQTAYTFSLYPENLVAPTFLDCFRTQDLGAYLIVGGAVMQITLITDAHSIAVQIINSTIQTSIPFTNPANGNQSIIMQAQSAGTWSMETPSFTAGHGYPTAVCFFQDRLMFAGTTDQPQNVWGSVTGDFENFAKGAQDDDALDEEINSGFREQIVWLSAYQGQVAAGTLESEYVFSGGAGALPGAGLGAAITPTNFSAAIQSRYGVSTIQPLFVESHLIYIQRALQTVYEFSYDIYQGIFGSKNMNILHDLVTTSGWKEVDYAPMPYRLLGFIDNSGNLATLTYNREQDVWAWARHYTGQDLTTPDSWMSIASIPNTTGLADQFWFVVKRTINGSSVGFIEIFDPTNDIMAGDSASMQTFSPATGTISGMGYLLGRTVAVSGLMSGGGGVANLGTFVVDATGQIVLPAGQKVQSVQIGLPSYSQCLTVRPEVPGGGTIQGLMKNWNRIWVRLYRAHGLLINGATVPMRQPSIPMGQGVPAPVGTNPDPMSAEGGLGGNAVYNIESINPLPAYTLATVDAKIENLGFDRDGRVLIQQLQPLPCTILAMFGALNIGEQ